MNQITSLAEEIQHLTPGVRALKLQLEAHRLQDEYATKRYAHTEQWRRDYASWQRELTRARTRLLGLIKLKA